jgi:hypothetical protein
MLAENGDLRTGVKRYFRLEILSVSELTVASVAHASFIIAAAFQNF